jgi:hypothetical protein
MLRIVPNLWDVTGDVSSSSALGVSRAIFYHAGVYNRRSLFERWHFLGLRLIVAVPNGPFHKRIRENRDLAPA